MSINTALLNLEYTSICDIRNFIASYVTCRIRGNDVQRSKQQVRPPIPNLSAQKAFVSELTQRLKSHFPSPVEQAPFKEISIDNSCPAKFDMSLLRPYLNTPPESCCFYRYQKMQGELNRQDILCIFTSADAISKFLNKHRLSIEDCDISTLSGDRILSLSKTTPGFMYSFSTISSDALLAYDPNQHPFSVEAFSEIHLEKMLDFGSLPICYLLPYLFSSYIYNFRKNSLMRDGASFRSAAFEDEAVFSSDAYKVRKNLDKFSDKFKFPDNLQWKDTAPLYRESPDSEPHIRSISRSIWNPEDSCLYMWGIFITLVHILTVDNTLSNPVLTAPIDVEKSFLLFNARTGIISESDYAGKSITSFLAEEYEHYFANNVDWADGQMGGKI